MKISGQRRHLMGGGDFILTGGEGFQHDHNVSHIVSRHHCPLLKGSNLSHLLYLLIYKKNHQNLHYNKMILQYRYENQMEIILTKKISDL